MPRTGSTWSENVVYKIPGFVHFEKRHKMNMRFSRLSVPHLSFFRDPTHWYLSMYYYYQKRRSGDIYACLNSPLRIKNIYARESSRVWQGSKLFVLSQIFATIYGPMQPDMSLSKFIKEINSKKTMALLGYGKLKEKEDLTIYQAMFFDAISRNKKVICFKSLMEEVYSLLTSEKLVLIELNSKTFSNKFFLCMETLGFTKADLAKAQAKATSVNRNSNNDVEYSNDLENLSPRTFPEVDYTFYSELKKLCV